MSHSTKHYFDLLFGMTEKELKARYKNTVFGFLWMVINPILQMLVIGFVFTFFFKEPVAHYYEYLFIGLLVWNYFSLSLTKATACIVNERSLIHKANFPHTVLPLSIILSDLIHFLLGLAIFAVILSIQDVTFITRLPYFFAGIILLTCFTTGLSLLTATLNTFYRDVAFFIQAILIVWFYATPIVYSLSVIPSRLLWLWEINPLTIVLYLFHRAFINNISIPNAVLISNIVIIAGMTVIGIAAFQKFHRIFIDLI
jgi:ABC-2 type transport system permease protein